MLFGCKDHTWEKFFAWFGWRRREPVQRPSSPSRAGAETERLVNTAGGKEKRRDAILVRLTTAASCAAIVSMVTDLVGLFD